MRAFAVTLAALLALVVGVNAAGEWLQARRDAALREAAGALRPGLAVLDYTNVDERGFQRARLEAIERPRTVAFGSSRIMQLTTAAAGAAAGEFYNTGMSGATIEDHVAMWAVLLRQGKVPATAIFALDPWIFNTAHEQVRWRVLAAEIDRYRRATGAGGAAALLGPLDEVVYRWYQARELLSYAVLRKSAGDVRRAARAAASGDGWHVAPEAEAAGGQLLRADGSLRYEGAFLARPPAVRRATAVRYGADLLSKLHDFRWDAARVADLQGLWTDMRRRGVAVVAFVPPYHPAAWRILGSDERFQRTVATGARALERAAAPLGVVFGDFSDPASVPCREEEFHDGDHATVACLERLLRVLSANRHGLAATRGEVRAPGKSAPPVEPAVGEARR
jgi:hypothetical protein